MFPLFLTSGNDWAGGSELMFAWSASFSLAANISETHFLAFYSVIILTMGGLRQIAGSPSSELVLLTPLALHSKPWQCGSEWVPITGPPGQQPPGTTVWALQPGNMVSSQYRETSHTANTTPPHNTTPHIHTWSQNLHLWELLSPK